MRGSKICADAAGASAGRGGCLGRKKVGGVASRGTAGGSVEGTKKMGAPMHKEGSLGKRRGSGNAGLQGESQQGKRRPRGDQSRGDREGTRKEMKAGRRKEMGALNVPIGWIEG
jgi:hypothetical protein